MQKNLVIVESPAKAKTIEKFLGDDFKVMSSYGHIRDLKKKEMSIDIDTLEPVYEIPEEKIKLVKDLKSNAEKAEKVWLASDEDREGEAISWHLCEVLGLDGNKTNRIVFHEITKPAILKAIETPRHLDMNLVNAQQARRVLDRLVGFKLSPVLWRKVKPALSAGRVQSVAVRLIVEREREIQDFNSEPYYSIAGIFAINNPDGSQTEVKATLAQRMKTHEEVEEFLKQCIDATFTVDAVSKKPMKRTPAPATGSCPQTGLHCQSDHDGGSASVRTRTDNLYAYRLCKSLRTVYQCQQGRDYQTLRRGIQQGAPVSHQLEGCSGGSRGYPSHLYGPFGNRGYCPGT